MRHIVIIVLTLLAGCHMCFARPLHLYEPQHDVSHAYQLIDVLLEASAQDVERDGAKPTILSRQMVLPAIAMYDAWTVYDNQALPIYLKKNMRLKGDEESANTAISYAAFRTMLDVLPHQRKFLEQQMQNMGLDPSFTDTESLSPASIGNYIAQVVIQAHANDGANQSGMRSDSKIPYSDYTQYQSVNGDGEVKDPNRWGPIPFIKESGEIYYPTFLTPHWGYVKPLALKSGDQFRPGPPPQYGDPQLQKEVDEIIELNATLTPEDKALVEFMRDGPRSTGQSGHWLRFAQDVSRRDKHNLEQDIKLFVAVAGVAYDAFIASWETKRFYDSARPWHLVRYYYKGQQLRGWRGPGKGVGLINAEDWLPYSPLSFLTPPFPSYVSGHSTVSSAAAQILRLYTGSDKFGFKEIRTAGTLTEADYSCEAIQKQYDLETIGDSPKNCKVILDLDTFTSTAKLAGISRVKGAYHIQADNIEGIKLGEKVALWSWQYYQNKFNGKVFE